MSLPSFGDGALLGEGRYRFLRIEVFGRVHFTLDEFGEPIPVLKAADFNNIRHLARR